MKRIRLITLLLAVAAITGCAHPFIITPDISKIESAQKSERIDKHVGYYISPKQRRLSVITPGGGGDKVEYYPYRDMEAGFYRMLSNVFNDVTVLKSPYTPDELTRSGIDYVVIPEIKTDTSSPSPFTWPPTDVTVELKCDIADINGKPIASRQVTGIGHADYDEFTNDFSLSGERASLDALVKMQSELLHTPVLRR